MHVGVFCKSLSIILLIKNIHFLVIHTCTCTLKTCFVFFCFCFFFFGNIFVTGFPVKFGLLSPGRARQRQCRAYPGHWTWGNRTLFWWWRKPECPEETIGTWSAPKIPFIRCNISSATSWDRTHTQHRHWLQACESDTSVAPWTARPLRTPCTQF
jgi:hypothetical protein